MILQYKNFRVLRCDKTNCTKDDCINYHNISSRRRKIIYSNGEPNYNCDKYCPTYNILTGKCLTGDSCKHLHRNSCDTELLFHPEVINRYLCSKHFNPKKLYNFLGTSRFQENFGCTTLCCAFSHNKYDEYVIKPDHKTKCEILEYDDKWKNMDLILRKYKTEKCPKVKCINTFLCPYFHTLKDKRKNVMNTEPIYCKDGRSCADADCNLCHNKCEYVYTVSVYKSKICIAKDYRRCWNEWFCPNSHEIEPEQLPVAPEQPPTAPVKLLAIPIKLFTSHVKLPASDINTNFTSAVCIAQTAPVKPPIVGASNIYTNLTGAAGNIYTNLTGAAGNIYTNLTSATHAACGSVEAGNLTSATHATCGSVEAGATHATYDSINAGVFATQNLNYQTVESYKPHEVLNISYTDLLSAITQIELPLEAKLRIRCFQLREHYYKTKLLETKKDIEKLLNGVCSFCLINKSIIIKCKHMKMCLNCSYNSALICEYC